MSCLFALLLTFFFVAERAVAIGKKSDICGSWNNYCKGPPTSSNPTPGYNRPPVYKPSPAELERRRKNEAATDLNNKGLEYVEKARKYGQKDFDNALYYYNMGIQKYEEALRLRPNSQTTRNNHRIARGDKANLTGIMYDNKGDLAKAIQYYKEAFQYNPENKSIQRNLRGASADAKWQAEEAASKAAEAKRKQAAEREHQHQLVKAKKEITRILDNLSTELGTSNTSIYSQARSTDSLGFMGPDESLPLKGAKNPSSLQGLSFYSPQELQRRDAKKLKFAPRKKPKGTSTKPGVQLKSTQKTGRDAATAGSPSKAKGDAQLGFDTLGEPTPAGAITYPKNLGKNPWKAPVVTDADRQRIPQIRAIERNRQLARQNGVELVAKLEKLRALPSNQKPGDWKIQEVLIKQEISDTEKKEQFYNFSIGELLRKNKKQP